MHTNRYIYTGTNITVALIHTDSGEHAQDLLSGAPGQARILQHIVHAAEMG